MAKKETGFTMFKIFYYSLNGHTKTIKLLILSAAGHRCRTALVQALFCLKLFLIVSKHIYTKKKVFSHCHPHPSVWVAAGKWLNMNRTQLTKVDLK